MIALIIGMLVSLIVTLVGTPLLIRLVHKLHYGQYIRQDGPQSHLVKRGTPTLGGVVINFAILLGWASSALYRYLRSGVLVGGVGAVRHAVDGSAGLYRRLRQGA